MKLPSKTLLLTGCCLLMAAGLAAADYEIIYIATGDVSKDDQSLSTLRNVTPEYAGDTITVVTVESVAQAQAELNNANNNMEGGVVVAHGNMDGDYDPSTQDYFSNTIATQADAHADPADVTTDQHEINYCGRNGFTVFDNMMAQWCQDDTDGDGSPYDSWSSEL